MSSPMLILLLRRMHHRSVLKLRAANRLEKVMRSSPKPSSRKHSSSPSPSLNSRPRKRARKHCTKEKEEDISSVVSRASKRTRLNTTHPSTTTSDNPSANSDSDAEGVSTATPARHADSLTIASDGCGSSLEPHEDHDWLAEFLEKDQDNNVEDHDWLAQYLASDEDNKDTQEEGIHEGDCLESTDTRVESTKSGSSLESDIMLGAA